MRTHEPNTRYASSFTGGPMDPSRVAAIAARHRALQVDPQPHHLVDDEQAAERLRMQVDACCGSWVTNAARSAMPTTGIRIRAHLFQRHPDTIVVRSSDDAQETVTFTRTSQRSTHGNHIEAHRYSSHAAPVDLAIEGHVEDHRFALWREGRPITPADAALVLLERFTDALLNGAAVTE